MSNWKLPVAITPDAKQHPLRLPNVTASSGPMSGVGNKPFGLLGSDVLSRFGSVTIDYRDQLMVLGG